MAALSDALRGSYLSEEQADWVAARMPKAGRLTTAEDAVYAYRLRRAHTSYSTLAEMFACSRSSVQRAIRLVSAQRGDDPQQWLQERRQRRREAVGSWYAHRAKVRLRREVIERETRELREANGIVLSPPAPPLPEGPRNAFAEQRRLADADARPPSQTPSFPPGLTPARRPVNPFER